MNTLISHCMPSSGHRRNGSRPAGRFGAVSRIMNLVGTLVVGVTLVAPASAVTIENGQFIGNLGAGTGESLAGLRFRSFQPTGGDEMYLGVPSLGTAGNRVAQQLNWMTDPLNPLTSFNFKFQFDQTLDTLVGEITGAAFGTATINWANWSASLASRGKTKGAADLNALQISIGSQVAGSNVYLTDLDIDGIALGSFTPPTAPSGTTNWLVTGQDMNLTNGFTLTGKLWLEGPFSSSAEASVVNLSAGWDTRGEVPEPTTLALVGLGCLCIAARRLRSA